VDQHPDELVRIFGESTRVWAKRHHEVDQEWWQALSGDSDANLNLTCCQSPSAAVLNERCLQPILELEEPGIVMLAGAGLANAQALIDNGWVSVGATALMWLASLAGLSSQDPLASPLSVAELVPARAIITDAFGLNERSAKVVLPDSVFDDAGVSAWGIHEGSELKSTATIVEEAGLAVVWSMATAHVDQGRGYGRRLLVAVLEAQRARGAAGSLLLATRAGERLYRSVGYSVVDYLQLWSRPRWVLARA